MIYSSHITVEDQDKFIHLMKKFTIEGFAMILYTVLKEYSNATHKEALDFQKTIEDYLKRNKIEILDIHWHEE